MRPNTKILELTIVYNLSNHDFGCKRYKITLFTKSNKDTNMYEKINMLSSLEPIDVNIY